jgi:hypothetical protein
VQGGQKLRSEAYYQARGNDEVEAQRRRWIFYEKLILFIIDNQGLSQIH